MATVISSVMAWGLLAGWREPGSTASERPRGTAVDVLAGQPKEPGCGGDGEVNTDDFSLTGQSARSPGGGPPFAGALRRC
jgi:hypothetical protein